MAPISGQLDAYLAERPAKRLADGDSVALLQR